MPAAKPLALPGVWLGPWALAVAVVVVGSLGPPPPSVGDLPNTDKWMHVGAYLVLGVTAVQVFPRSVTLGAAAAGLIGLGVLLEIGQGTLTDGRMMDGWDAVANGIGVALGVSTAWLPGRDLLLTVERRFVGPRR